MDQNDRERLLNEILPQVASQLRMPLGNMHVAMQRLVPKDPADEKTERNAAIMAQSYYRAMRLVNNLAAAPMLLETTPFLTANVELVGWLEKLVQQAGGKICGRMAILAEGDAQQRKDLIYLEKLPLFNAAGEVIG